MVLPKEAGESLITRINRWLSTDAVAASEFPLSVIMLLMNSVFSVRDVDYGVAVEEGQSTIL